MSESRTPNPGNRLCDEGSLYLRQHAENPIHWQPWDDAALARARVEDKPVFLSVGYSSCHWCHVMEHEVFECRDVAAYVNERFVCIKVDREERPDLDGAYMEAVQAMTGGGGWPMSTFLTPDLHPFWGGTYLPRDAFLELCERVDRFWTERRDDVCEHAREIAARLGRVPDDPPAPLDAASVSAAAAAGLEAYDPGWGGFRQRQKFPTPPRWRFLLHHALDVGDEAALKAVRHTLNAMASGGIRDQVGGAFHRYATEPTWLVPHFEIMLYDNAQLAALYLEAGEAFDETRYVDVSLGVLDFLLCEMRDERGGFHASFDADSGGEEGSFYVWTPEEIAAVCGPQDGPLLAHLLGVTPGGNFEGKSIPTLRVPVAEAAQDYDRPEDEVGALFPKWREALYEKRAERTRPGLDRKIVTAWNGLAVSALARAFAATGEASYRDAARGAVDFLWSAHRDDRGRLARASTDGAAGGEGVLDDYAFLLEGLIDLHAADGDAGHRERAEELAATALDLFAGDDGTLYLTPEDVAAPLGRRVEVFDSVEPSGGAAMTRGLVRLGALNDDPGLLAAADAALRARSGLIARSGLETAWWADAALRRLAMDGWKR